MPHRKGIRRAALCPLFLAAVAAAAYAQIGYSDADRAGWEAFLLKAKIGDALQLHGQEATTSPWKLTLSQGDVTRFGLWKNVDRSADEGGPDCWRYEIAAYQIDKLLGLDMVPPTVERIFRSDRGSLQLWMDATVSLKSRMANGPDAPAVGAVEWNRKAYLQRAFDSLVANDDRNTGNILIADNDKRMILIDHSRTFRTAPPFDAALVYGAKGLMKAGDGTPHLFAELPRALVQKLRALDAQAVKDAVKSHLTSKEIRAVLDRRDLMLKEIDGLIKAKGEDKVLY